MESLTTQVQDTTKNIFDTVLDTFSKELSAEEAVRFKACANTQELIETIQKATEANNANHDKLSACFGKIESFSKRIRPFFDIITICVQNTQYAAWAWGAIRLVFLLGEQHASFLVKLSGMFDKMAQRLPAYESYMNALAGLNEHGLRPHKRLIDALGLVFLDIIQFCSDACRLFSGHKRGKLISHRQINTVLSRAQLALRLAWQPFETRFKDIIERFEEHSRLFEFEMKVSFLCVEIKSLERLQVDTEKNIADASEHISRSRNAIQHLTQRIERRREIISTIELGKDLDEGGKSIAHADYRKWENDNTLLGLEGREKDPALFEPIHFIIPIRDGISHMQAAVEDVEIEISRTEQSIQNLDRELDARKVGTQKSRTDKEWIEHVNDKKQKDIVNGLFKSYQRQQEDIRPYRIRDLKTWINAPDWEESYEKCQYTQVPGTGAWLLENAVYKRWLSSRSHSATLNKNLDLDARILVMQAKPGYGKTALCSNMIHSFRNRREESDTKEFPIFYFFDAQGDRTNTAGHCMRSMVTQLVHEFADEDEVIDTATFLMSTTGRGQRTATEDEVCSILKLFLQRMKGIFLFIDGIDECSDQRTFSRHLRDIAGHSSSCSVILFSRANCSLLSTSFSKCEKLRLVKSMNVFDIQCYLRGTLENLTLEGILPDHLDLDNAVNEVTERADGMFLWATLFINYLQSCALTMEDRVEILSQYSHLSGLDALYSAILKDISARFPEPRQQSNIKRAFQWVAGAARPLKVEELQIASRIRPGHSTGKTGLLPGFDQSLAEFSGSLLEVTNDTVRFIHLSVREYLTRSGDQQPRFQERYGFDVPFIETQSHLASSCLSYLLEDVPAEPLSGSASVTPSKELQYQRYPLLFYILHHWTHHTCAAIRGGNGCEAITTYSKSLAQLIKMMEMMLNDRKKISMFIEASWVFNIPPSLGDIPKVLASISNLDSMRRRKEKRNKRQALMQMRKASETLSKDLKDLNDTWGLVLEQHPNEIWLPSISAFNPSQFWMRVSDASFQSLNDSPEPLKHLVIESQVSQNGLHIGLIKLFPSVTVLCENGGLKFGMTPSYEILGRGVEAEKRAKGWTARYEIWQLKSQLKLFECSIDIPPDEVERFIYNAMFTQRWPYFHFPVAFSNDLRKVAILGCTITVDEFEDRNLNDDMSLKLGYQIQQIGLWKTSQGDGAQFSMESVQVRFSPAHVHRLKFSPCGSHLLVIHGLDSMYQDYLKQGWVIELYSCKGTWESSQPKFTYRKSLTAYPGKKVEISMVSKFIAFHSCLPVVAIAREKDCILWSLEIENGPGSSAVEAIATPLQDIFFSDRDYVLYGVARNKTTVTLREQFSAVDEIMNFDITSKIKELLPATIKLPGIDTGSGTNISADSLLPFASTQSANMVVMNPMNPQGHQNGGIVSTLHDNVDASAIVHTLASSNGILQSSVLARLPLHLRSQISTTIISSQISGDVDNITLVLNKASQVRYCVGDAESQSSLPGIFERSVSSIETVSRIEQVASGSIDAKCADRKRKGICDNRRGKMKRLC